MQRPQSFRFTLLISVAGIVTLAGCDTSNLADKISGREGRKEQLVDGPRRAPLLNPRPNMAPPAMPQEQQAPPAARPQAAADSPFDQFDETGAMVAPEPAKPLEMAGGDEAGTVDSGFFDRLIPDRKAEAPAAEAKKAPEKPIRKPFIANVLSASDEEAPLLEADDPKPLAKQVMEPEPVFAEAPEPKSEPKTKPAKIDRAPEPALPAIPLTAAQDRDAVTGFVPLAPEPAQDKPLAVSDAEPVKVTAEKPAAVTEEKQVVEQEPIAASKPSLLSRLIAPVVGDKTETSLSDDGSADKVEPFPELSSVPPRPETFKAIRGERDQQIEALKNEHAAAKEQKQVLAEEPSELASPSMLVSPSLPVAEPVKQPAAIAAPQPPAEEPVLLGRIADPKLANNGDEATGQPAAAPIEYKEDKIVEPVKSQPAPVALAKPEAVVIAETPPAGDKEQTPWWKRLGVFSDQPASADDPAVQQADKQPKKPLVIEEPVTTVQPFRPELEVAPVQPSITPIIEPVKAVKTRAAVQNEDEQGDSADGAPPLSAKPADVKTLPPSRYTPPRQRQYYLVP